MKGQSSTSKNDQKFTREKNKFFKKNITHLRCVIIEHFFAKKLV